MTLRGHCAIPELPTSRLLAHETPMCLSRILGEGGQFQFLALHVIPNRFRKLPGEGIICVGALRISNSREKKQLVQGCGFEMCDMIEFTGVTQEVDTWVPATQASWLNTGRSLTVWAPGLLLNKSKTSSFRSNYSQTLLFFILNQN